ncbi:TMM81 protein, partial [Psilopogon haemacephalus]|nr:TMM81 protein [Psilopogon haemacephalus]
MKTPRRSHPGGLLLWAFSLPLVLSSLQPVTIPAELRSAMLQIAVNATPCSVTCGLGIRLEQLCEVTGAGERRNCTLQRSTCLASWMCGLLHFTVPAGKPFQLSCLPSDVVAFGTGAYRYRWRFAPGLITTNKLLLKPFRNPDPVLRFATAREADAGTYQCDVQGLKNIQVVKRVYFGVKVIRDELADLDFDKSLTWEQKLVANKQGGTPQNSSQEQVQSQEHPWQGKPLGLYWVGLGSGVIGGVLVSLVAAWLCKKVWR